MNVSDLNKAIEELRSPFGPKDSSQNALQIESAQLLLRLIKRTEHIYQLSRAGEHKDEKQHARIDEKLFKPLTITEAIQLLFEDKIDSIEISGGFPNSFINFINFNHKISQTQFLIIIVLYNYTFSLIIICEPCWCILNTKIYE